MNLNMNRLWHLEEGEMFYKPKFQDMIDVRSGINYITCFDVNGKERSFPFSDKILDIHYATTLVDDDHREIITGDVIEVDFVFGNKHRVAIVMTDYLTVTYECAVFTYYVEQLNKIVEAMEYASDAYWGNPQRYQFKAMIDSFGFQTELAQEDDRIVRSTFSIKLNGYIIPEILQKDITALKKFSNKTTH